MACVRELRISVATAVDAGMTGTEVAADLPGLTVEDIAEALRCAEAVRERAAGAPAGLSFLQNLAAIRGRLPVAPMVIGDKHRLCSRNLRAGRRSRA